MALSFLIKMKQRNCLQIAVRLSVGIIVEYAGLFEKMQSIDIFHDKDVIRQFSVWQSADKLFCKFSYILSRGMHRPFIISKIYFLNFLLIVHKNKETEGYWLESKLKSMRFGMH